jgi:hypothetical protein
MTMNQRICGVLAAVLLVVSPVWGQVTPADYARSEGLREAWMYLTENVADPAVWIGDTSEFIARRFPAGSASW